MAADDQGRVLGFRDAIQSGLRINGGFFVFREGIWEVLGDGEELVEQPFTRLAERRQLIAYQYDGFWMPMDTAKDKQRLDDLHASGKPPWYVWDSLPGRRGRVE